MKRVVVVGATVIALALGAASGASADDRGNHGPPWELVYPESAPNAGERVHQEDGEDINSGSEWGEHISGATPEYTNPNLGDSDSPGISEGVHLLKGNGPE
jgi:hypothetical protein